MASVAQVRAHLLAIKKFAEDTSTNLHSVTGDLGGNLDLVEYGEGLVLLREALAELQSAAYGAVDFCHQLTHRMDAEGIS